MNWKRLLISLLIVSGIVAGGYWAYKQYLAPTPESQATATADVNALAIDTGIDNVTAEGRVVPRQEAMLSFLMGGEVREILVTEGQVVAAGAPLLRLDNRDQEILVRQAETAVQQAHIQVDAARAGLAAAQVGVLAANVSLAAAQAQLALLTEAPTEAQIALNEAIIAAAAAGVSQAAGSQAVVLEGSSTAEIGLATAQLAAAQAQLQVTQLQTNPVLQGESSAAAREQAQLRLNAAIAAVTAAQAELDDLQAGAPAANLQAAAGAVSAAVGQQNVAQAQLDLLLAGPRPQAIAVVEAGLAQAERAITEAELQVRQAESAVSQAEAALVVAQAAQTAAQSLLDKMTLTAPFAGTVASVPVRLGEVVSAGFPALILAEWNEGWQIETTDLTEQNVVAIKVGDPVLVTIDALPNQPLNGRVSNIASASELVRGDVTYVVTIDLLPHAGGVAASLRWGMTAFVTIEISN